MMESLDVRSLLTQALTKEYMNDDISTLQSDFYKIIKEYLNRLSEDDRTQQDTTYNTLILTRKSKILQAVETGIFDMEFYNKLALEEQILYGQLISAIQKFGDVL